MIEQLEEGREESRRSRLVDGGRRDDPVCVHKRGDGLLESLAKMFVHGTHRIVPLFVDGQIRKQVFLSFRSCLLQFGVEGQIIDGDALPSMLTINQQIEDVYGFKVQQQQQIFYGLCPKCQQATDV